MNVGDHAGDIVLEREGGRGGKGAVIQGRERSTGDAVAVKTLEGGRENVQRFLREPSCSPRSATAPSSATGGSTPDGELTG